MGSIPITDTSCLRAVCGHVWTKPEMGQNLATCWSLRLLQHARRVIRFLGIISAFGMDQEIPDYDMDSEDETWLTKQAKKMEVTPLQFENMMDRLEKGSGQVVGVSIMCELFSVPILQIKIKLSV